MANDHKDKLKAFIADIPEPPGEITSGDPLPVPYTPEFTEKLEKDKNFTLPTNPLFQKYTGLTQLGLVKSWAKGGLLTSCNSFVGQCGIAMGAKQFLGVFELEDFLRKNNKAHAWVPADSGKRPGYGDVFRPVSYHMGISLGFDDGTWLTVEGGQGGPKRGCDSVKRKRPKFDPADLQGWCDIRLYLDPRGPVPDWLVGTWVVYCGNDTYTYHFNQYYDCSYYPFKTLGGPEKTTPMDTGTVAFQGGDSFTVTWSKEGGIERFTYDRFNSFPGIMEKMNGTSGRGEALKGVRL
jgi:hypothetical protein